jgi:hypothetical protein
MDPWKETSVWKFGRDEAREWAALEGKSQTMSEDLYRGNESRTLLRRGPLRMLNYCAHVGVWIVEVWRFFRSG